MFAHAHVVGPEGRATLEMQQTQAREEARALHAAGPDATPLASAARTLGVDAFKQILALQVRHSRVG